MVRVVRYAFRVAPFVRTFSLITFTIQVLYAKLLHARLTTVANLSDV